MTALAFMIVLFRSGSAPSLGSSVYQGVLYGLLLAIPSVTVHLIIVRKCAGWSTVLDTYGAAQERELNLSMPYEKLFDLCLRYVTDTAGYSVSEANPGKNLIIARTPLNWKGFGNIFSITFSEIKDGPVKLKISSRPRLPIVLLDYADNLEKVLRAANYLQASVHQPESFS